ncbi:MAG: hypothetical protein WD671_04380 [Parvibaculum sp.]
MPASLPAERIIAIWLGAGGPERATATLDALRDSHVGSRMILLTTPDAPRSVVECADDVWIDGAVRGAAAFLARARRLSWASPAFVYDLEGSPATRWLHFCVWPRPQWRLVAPGSDIRPLS